MKKKFKKLGKISFVIGFIALFIMVVFAFIDTDGEVEMPGALLLFCILGTFLLLVCIVISAIITIVEGIRKKNLELFKKIVVQFVVFMILYLGASFFVESLSANIVELMIRSLVMSLGIVGVEYILSEDSEKEKLHF